MDLSVTPITAAAKPPWPTRLKKTTAAVAVPNSAYHYRRLIARRSFTLTLLAGVAVDPVSISGDQNAIAAGRRPPPPPPAEKKDPNVSGLKAKLIASKKRKEALKEEIENERQRAKSITDQRPP